MNGLRIRAPATSAYLGPGFDCLGIALRLYNELHVSETDSLVVEGCEPGHEGPDNLFVATYMRGKAELGVPFRPILIRFASAIPIARGLGSSSTCIVVGLLAASAAAAGSLGPGSGPVPQAAPLERLLDLAAEIEGHPDNVTPAFFGGFAAAEVEGGHVVSVRASIGREPVFNAIVPPLPLETAKSREYSVLDDACSDRLHEPFHAPLIPGLDETAAAARAAGALEVFLSGAGPTVMAICREDDGRFAAAMESYLASRDGSPRRLFSLRADGSGASAVRVG